jgi:hypothetical protein
MKRGRGFEALERISTSQWAAYDGREHLSAVDMMQIVQYDVLSLKGIACRRQSGLWDGYCVTARVTSMQTARCWRERCSTRQGTASSWISHRCQCTDCSQGRCAGSASFSSDSHTPGTPSHACASPGASCLACRGPVEEAGWQFAGVVCVQCRWSV